MRIRVIDFETTGLPPDASVCEAAFIDLCGEPLNIAGGWQRLVQPSTEMSLEALATHHITAEEAHEKGVSWAEATDILGDHSPDLFAAHNADFEKEFFNPEGSQWIDTYKVGLKMWPDAPRHTNQVLRYYHDLDVGERAMPPHRAAPDAWVTANLLLKALESATIAELVQWSDEPPYLTKLGFGKHFGKKYSEVPRDYLQWIVRQDMDAGVIAAAKRELGL